MERYEVPEDARLADLVERAARGDEVVIVRAGRVVAKVHHTEAPPVPKDPAPIDLEALAALRARIPLWKDDAAKVVDQMRNDEPE